MQIELSEHEARMLRDLAGWALDQAHDARGMGDPQYLWFLSEEEGMPEEVDTEAVEAVVEAAHAKLSAALG